MTPGSCARAPSEVGGEVQNSRPMRQARRTDGSAWRARRRLAGRCDRGSAGARGAAVDAPRPVRSKRLTMISLGFRRRSAYAASGPCGRLRPEGGQRSATISRSRRTTGISREVRLIAADTDGVCSVIRRRGLLRSSGLATRARTSSVSVPISALASGFAEVVLPVRMPWCARFEASTAAVVSSMRQWRAGTPTQWTATASRARSSNS